MTKITSPVSEKRAKTGGIIEEPDRSLCGGWGSVDENDFHEASSVLGTGFGGGSRLTMSDVTYKTHRKAKYVKQYMLGELLGSGAYGKVREAVDSRTARRVAVKILNKRVLRKVRNGEENIRREIRIMKKLKSHPNLIELLEVICLEDKDKLYIILELANGGSLQQLLDVAPEGRLRDSQARWYFRQLIIALEYVHSQGIVHRDIKPANLMVTPEHVLKITDFGVAEILDTYVPQDTTSQFSGSPAFQPPEMASGRDGFSGFKTDIWAAGVTLFLMVAGRLPFDGDNVFALFENIQKGEFELPEHVGPECADLLRRMLEQDEGKRPGLQEILKHPWVVEGAELGLPATTDWAKHPSDKRQFLNLLELFHTHTPSPAGSAPHPPPSHHTTRSSSVRDFRQLEQELHMYVKGVAGKFRRWLGNEKPGMDSNHHSAKS